MSVEGMASAATAPPEIRADVPSLDFSTVRWMVLVVVASVVATGLVIWWARSSLSRRSNSDSLIRSWLALSLLIGLLVFCAASFALTDPNLRNTLFGGLIASSGASTAFYFASKDADQARRDVLDASFGTVIVPALEKKTVEDARVTVAHSALELHVDPSDAAADYEVVQQVPPAGTSARKGSVVTITAAPAKSSSPQTSPNSARQQVPGAATQTPSP
jgi:hypothetical protein